MIPLDWRPAPQLRCGICQQWFEPGEDRIWIDDERCHRDCDRLAEPDVFWDEEAA